jgi:hypothetical protein
LPGPPSRDETFSCGRSASIAEKLVTLFWLALGGAVAVAFLTDAGAVRWCAVATVGAIGSLFSLGNWLCLVAALRTRRHVSLVPMLGGALVTLAALAAPAGPGWLPLLGLVVDPSILLTICGVFVKLGGRNLEG